MLGWGGTPWKGDDFWRYGLLLLLVALFGLAVTEVHSFDIFWQLQSGRYLLETGSFLHTDLFTLASDAPRFEHCWLHDVIFYLVWSAGGAAAVSWLKGLLITGTVWVLMAIARLRGSSWWAIFCCLPVVLWTSGGWLERPQLWTFFFFALTLFLLERFDRQPGRVLLWLAPVAMTWANLHAGSVLLPALVLASLVGSLPWRETETTGRDWRRVRWLAGALVACLLVPLATPYPVEWYRTLVGVASYGGGQGGAFSQVFNMDWRPTTWANEPWFFYVLGGMGVTLALGWRRLSARDLCLLAGLTLMGLKLSRHTSFLLFALVAVLPVYLDSAADWLRLGPETMKGLVFRLLSGGLVIWLAVVLMRPVFQADGWFRPGLRNWHYPVAATDFLRNEQLPANIYNTYDWGGYLAFRLYPDYLVFWDGRQDDKEMFAQGWRVMAGKEDWQQILDRYQVKTIMTRCLTMDTGQRYPLLDRLEKSADWALVYADDWSLVFVRVDAVSAAWLRSHQLDKARIWQTLYSEALLSLQENRWRYKAWWELARLDLRRRRYTEAERHLKEYLSRSPVPDPVAESYLRMLMGLRGGRS